MNKPKCPECGFIAKNAAGLGSHRKNAHGISGANAAKNKLKGKGKKRAEAIMAAAGVTTLEEAIKALRLEYSVIGDTIKKLEAMLQWGR